MPVSGARRTQHELDPRAGVEADAGRLDRGLEGPLLQHVVFAAGDLAPRITAAIPSAVQWFRRNISTTGAVRRDRARRPTSLGAWQRPAVDGSASARDRSVRLLAQERRDLRRVDRRRRRRRRARASAITAGWSSFS